MLKSVSPEGGETERLLPVSDRVGVCVGVIAAQGVETSTLLASLIERSHRRVPPVTKSFEALTRICRAVSNPEKFWFEKSAVSP